MHNVGTASLPLCEYGSYLGAMETLYQAGSVQYLMLAVPVYNVRC
jgi:hypothetical protein